MPIPRSFEELGDWISNQTSISIQTVLVMDPNDNSGSEVWMPRKGVILPDSGSSNDTYGPAYGVTLDDNGNLIAIQAVKIPEGVIQNTPHSIYHSLKNITVYELKDTRNVMPWVDDRLPWDSYTVERMMSTVMGIRTLNKYIAHSMSD